MLSNSLKIPFLLLVLAAANANPLLAGGVSEIFLPRYQAEQMSGDQPFSDLAVRSAADDGAKGDVWFAGRTSLWQWQPADQSVRRYRLIEGLPARGARDSIQPAAIPAHRVEAAGLHRILVDPGSGALLVSSSDGMYEVDPASGRILHYPLPDKVQPVTTGLFGFGDHVIWTTPEEMIHLDRYGKRLRVVPLPQALKSADRLVWSAQNKWFWLTRGQTLSALSLIEGSKEKQVWLAPRPLAGMLSDQNSLFAWTGGSVARFSDTGKSAGKNLDTIKVDPSRQLSLVATATGTQGYLFTDGTLEIYVSGAMERHSYHLPLPSGRDANLIQSLALGGPDGRAQVFLLVAGKPRVFSLAKDLSKSQDGTNVESDSPKGK